MNTIHWSLEITQAPKITRHCRKCGAKEQLAQFLSNDSALALRCALDTHTLKRNGAQAAAPAYILAGDTIDFSSDTRILLQCPYTTDIRLSKALREKLGLSSHAFDQLVDTGRISLPNSENIYKGRLNRDYTILISASRQAEAP